MKREGRKRVSKLSGINYGEIDKEEKWRQQKENIRKNQKKTKEEDERGHDNNNERIRT